MQDRPDPIALTSQRRGGCASRPCSRPRRLIACAQPLRDVTRRTTELGLWRAKQPQAITAAAGPVSRAHLNNAQNRATALAPWQTEVDMYDEWGPGFVGSYLDLLAAKVAACGAVLYDGDRVSSDERAQSIFAGVWRTWRGPYSDTTGLLNRHSRLLLKHGEAFILRLDDGRYVVAHRDELKWENRIVKFRDPMTEKWVEVPVEGQRVWRSWEPLDRDPREPTCDLKRALPHIREYVNVKLRQDSDTTSPLVRNKILLFGQGTEVYQDEDGSPYNGMPDAFVDYLKLAQKADTRRYHDKRRGVDSVPFPMLGDKLETVDLGRVSDPQSQTLEDSAIYAFARSVRTPLQYIHSGPGVAKFENEAFVLEALITDAVEPTATLMLTDIWRVVMRKVFTDAYTTITGEVPRGQFTIGPDLDRIRSKVDNSAHLMEAYKVGAATRQAVAEAVDADPIPLPEGMSEFDLWAMAFGLKADAAAPAADAGARPAVTEPVGVAAAVTAGPRQLTAAPRQTPIERLLEEASQVDHMLVVALTAAAGMAYAATIDNAARRLARIAPSGSDLKKRLATVDTSTEKLALVTEADIAAYGITPEMLVTDDDYKALATQAEQDLKHALGAFTVALLAAVGGFAPKYRYRAGGQALADSMRDYTRFRVGSGGHQTNAEAELPTGVVRRALSVTGGQDLEATIQAGAAGGPMTRDSIVDSVGSPALTYTWRHGYYRTPKVPDAVHLSFNGYTASSFDEFGSQYPGDHYNCFIGSTVVSGPGPRGATLRYYEGDVIELTTASGQFLTATPNHPILTDHGWVAAGLLDEGSDVVRCVDAERVAGLIPGDYQSPTVIEEVTRAFGESAGVVSRSVPVATKDFHGDGVGSEVATVWADRYLRDSDDSAFSEPASESDFVGAASRVGLPSDSSSGKVLGRVRNATFGGVSVDSSGGSVLGSLSSGEDHGLLGDSSDSDSVSTESAGERGSVDAERLGESLEGLAGCVAFDQIVKVNRRWFAGHVYNLQTVTGWYLAESIVVHNCTCAITLGLA